MAVERKIWVRLSGTPRNEYDRPQNNNRYSSRMACHFLYITSLGDYQFSNEKHDYDYFFSDDSSYTSHPIILNYTSSDNSSYDVTSEFLGLCDLVSSTSSGTQGTFYRRQYDKYQKKQWDNDTQSVKVTDYEFVGPWEPVAIEVQSGLFRDFNVKSGHSYQYVMYPSNASQKQVFAKDRAKQDIYNAKETDTVLSTEGDAIHVDWSDWSIAELVEQENTLDAPILKKTYKVDLENIWMFKYSLDVGSQKQTLTKNQVTTLGQYPRVAHGSQNSISGSVSCLLGSEIVPYSKDGYVERMWMSIRQPLSTNEKILMLQKWRQFVFSKNPKLLKDTKGQSWIVSIIDNSNSPYNSYQNQPDKITFSWVEIESTDNIIIYGSGEEVERCGGASSLWKSTTA